MCGGRKCARKSQRGVGFPWNRLPVVTIFENLEDGLSIEEIMEQSDVTREQLTAVLDFAAHSLESSASDSPLMLILFDHGTPRGISRDLQGHIVKEARAHGRSARNSVLN
jgi:hypothetical protein